jgi:hypothetical protein
MCIDHTLEGGKRIVQMNLSEDDQLKYLNEDFSIDLVK